jgi:hypothetical protein
LRGSRLRARAGLAGLRLGASARAPGGRGTRCAWGPCCLRQGAGGRGQGGGGCSECRSPSPTLAATASGASGWARSQGLQPLCRQAGRFCGMPPHAVSASVSRRASIQRAAGQMCGVSCAGTSPGGRGPGAGAPGRRLGA